ncbi:hypothetical protein [Geodermatophilus obscurus]|uniref:Uncharacterized protein n=1 Tax=Geodermatophilus obscurus (strain ATCC 25078 / DSM 43160 / JCM 3152 / CCUG 61914 / KCC A-0152 / KCTC 9177 / NBRC 13315 / NRRL B-3577 / G-20) TaxID=526225 RepID=D2S600_GEOOG|nr:hypothetical protein [Geodermatophilus obscurus]ADB73217.1 hypothetical protein Gobs_0435 [Geodermatophilus obscurus DSM 43160]
MVDALTGWLGMVLIGLTVVLALAIEVRDERAATDGGAVPGGRRSRRSRRVWLLVLAVLVVASLAATGIRLATMAF